jgi:hypothetical protein
MRNHRSITPFLVAITVAAGCSSTESPAATDAPRAAEPTPSTMLATSSPSNDVAEPNGLDRVLLSDDFDSDASGWGGRFQSFEAGAYAWSLPPGQTDVRAADALIAIEDRITQHSTTIEFTAPNAAAVAIECAWEEIEASSRWYSLELSVDGAAIRKRPPGNDPSVDLAATDEVTLTDRPTTLEAICVRTADNYRLSLVVDGRTVLDTVDTDPYGPGAPNIAVRAATDGSADDITATFDRFEIRVPADGPTLPTAATPTPTTTS